jgi:excisionase family DNA binding protein
MSDRLLDAKAVAELLGVPKTRVRETARTGAIPHVRLGRYVRFDQADIEAWWRRAPGWRSAPSTRGGSS